MQTDVRTAPGTISSAPAPPSAVGGTRPATPPPPASPGFPTVRLRRLRRTDALRRLVRETTLGVDDLILPLFVAPGRGVREPIASMPGHAQLSLDELAHEVREVRDLGVPAVLLFGLPSRKDPLGSEAYDPHGIVQEAIRTVKE